MFRDVTKAVLLLGRDPSLTNGVLLVPARIPFLRFVIPCEEIITAQSMFIYHVPVTSEVTNSIR